MAENPFEAPYSDLRLHAREDSAPPPWRLHGTLLCLLPLLSYGYVVMFWLLASAWQGEWVRPHIDDPKIFLFGIPNMIQIVLNMLMFAVLPLIFALCYYHRRWWAPLIAYASSLLLTILLYRSDFHSITTWIAD